MGITSTEKGQMETMSASNVSIIIPSSSAAEYNAWLKFTYITAMI